MVMICIPIAVVTNAIYFGQSYFLALPSFMAHTLVTALVFSLDFIFCGFVAVMLKGRFPEEDQLSRRLAIMIGFFIMISVLFLLVLFRSYVVLPFSKTPFKETRFAWTCLSMAIVNIFITFLMEGIDRFNAWKANMAEAQKLNSTYLQSQLNGLKSQINPHFLFNSLNSLSSLIVENEEKAEVFLDEMSKVYRYLLSNEDKELVTLETELQFLTSYVHLLDARYGHGLVVEVAVQDRDRHLYVTPLLLQVIIENAFTQNVVSKLSPLRIYITSGDERMLCITNTIKPKLGNGEADAEGGLDNLVKRYQLMGQQVAVEESSNMRKIIIPLLDLKTEVKDV